MQLPTIHPNGTSKERLVLNLVRASDALDEAYQKLKETAPNRRDYYLQGWMAFDLALLEHKERLRDLDKIKDEIDKLTLAIDRIQ